MPDGCSAAGAVAITLALAAAGCGGDVADTNAYVDRVNLAQTQFAASFARLSREITATSSPPQDRKTLRSIEGAVESTVKDLRAIDPPDKVKTQHADLVEAIAGYGESLSDAESNLSGSEAQATAAEAHLASDTKLTSTRITAAISAINQKLRD